METLITISDHENEESEEGPQHVKVCANFVMFGDKADRHYMRGNFTEMYLLLL